MVGHTFLYDRYDRGYSYGQDGGRSRSPSPSKGWNRDRSCSRDRSPVLSFHQAMMERGSSYAPSQHQRVLPYNSGNAREPKGSPQGWSRSSGGGQHDGGFANGPHSSYFGEEEEEGLIPQDEVDK